MSIGDCCVRICSVFEVFVELVHSKVEHSEKRYEEGEDSKNSPFEGSTEGVFSQKIVQELVCY